MVRVAEAARWRRSQAALSYPSCGSTSLTAAAAVPVVAVDGNGGSMHAQCQGGDGLVQSPVKGGIMKGSGSLHKGAGGGGCVVDGGDLIRIPSAAFSPPLRQSTLQALDDDEDDK
jgi:hypothetical protein